MCKFFNLYEESLHLGVCKLAKYVRTALFSGKIYTSDKNFTRPPVATVATNSKSGYFIGQVKLIVSLPKDTNTTDNARKNSKHVFLSLKLTKKICNAESGFAPIYNHDF